MKVFRKGIINIRDRTKACIYRNTGMFPVFRRKRNLSKVSIEKIQTRVNNNSSFPLNNANSEADRK